MPPTPDTPAAAPDALLGRSAELAALEDALSLDRPALVSIVGAPGAGKSRLARHLATQLTGRRQRVVVAELSSAQGLDDVVARLASAADVGVEGADREAAIERLRRALVAPPAAIVVLDDADPVTLAVGELLMAWRAQPRAIPSLVVSARESLRLEGESVVRVPPLSTADAVELLRRGARTLEPGWDAPLEALEALAERLDRLPLALELAAGRLPVLGPGALRARLDARLDPLVNRRRDATARHGSLSEALALSWERLSDPERAGLSELTCFETTFEVTDAEAIVRGVDDVALALTDLVDRSLVASESGRFRILRTVRTWVRQHAPPDSRALDRHADWAACRAEALLEARPADRLHALRRLRDDMEAAWARRPDLRPGLALALDVPARHDEPASRRLRRLADAREQAPDDEALGLAYGEALRRAGRADEATAVLRALPRSAGGGLLATRIALDRGQLREVLAIAERELAADPEPACAAGLHRARGSALLYTGRPDEACGAFEQGLALATAAGDVHEEAAAHGNLGVAFQHRDPARAAAHLERALALAVDVGDREIAATAHTVLGMLDAAARRWSDAVTHYDAALAAHRASGRARDEAIVWTNRVELEQARGNVSAAVHAADQALETADEAGAEHVAAVATAQLGRLALERGYLPEAASRLDRAREQLAALGDRVHAAVATGYRALVSALWGQLDAARDDVAEVRRELTSSGAPLLLPLPALLEACLAALDADAAALAGLHERAEALLVRARGHLEGEDGGTDGAVLRRLLRRLVERAERRDAQAGSALVIGPDASWFRRADDAAVDLTTRPTLARVLDALAAHAGTGLDSLTLFAMAWPGEVAERESAMERVRAAVAALRRAGLRGALVRDGDGYLLAPDVEVVRWAGT